MHACHADFIGGDLIENFLARFARLIGVYIKADGLIGIGELQRRNMNDQPLRSAIDRFHPKRARRYALAYARKETLVTPPEISAPSANVSICPASR